MGHWLPLFSPSLKKEGCKEKPKKTTKQSIQPFLCFEGPTTAYFQSNHEDVEELSVFDADYDELEIHFDMKSSYKCGWHSSSNSKQSSIKQNKLVRAHTNKKEQKKEKRLRVNSDEQKTNIQKSLQTKIYKCLALKFKNIEQKRQLLYTKKLLN